MAQLIHPFFGDLVVKGAVLLAWLFVLFLIGDAWWEKRQVRVIREQGGIPWPNRADRRARPFFRRFCWAFVVLTVIPVVTLLLVGGTENDSSNSNGLSAYATNFQGDATCPMPVAKTVNFDFDNSSPAGAQVSGQTNNAVLGFEPPSSPQLSLNKENLSTPASSSGHKPITLWDYSSKAP